MGTTVKLYTYDENTSSWSADEQLSITAPAAASGLVYDGTSHDLITVEGSVNGYTMSYSSAMDGVYSVTSFPTGTNAGTYYVWYKVTDGSGEMVALDSVEVEISRRPVNVTANNTEKVYEEADPAFAFTIDSNTQLIGNDALTGTLTRAKGENVGTYAITQGTLTNEKNPNYDINFTPGTFTIAKAIPNVTAPTAKTGLVYTGTPQALVTAGSTDYGTLLYSLDGISYATSIPTGTAVDSYTVFYRVEGGANAEDVEEKAVLATIGKAQNAPNMPLATMNVANSCEKVSDVTLPTGWVWQDTDKNTELTVGSPVTATAVYNGTDKGNYENVTVSVTITRSAYDRVDGGGSGGGSYTPSVPDSPAQPQIRDDNGSTGWSAIENKIEETITNQTVGGTKEPIKIDMNGSTTVPKSVLDTVKGRDVTIVFDMGNGISWKINGMDVTGAAGDINFGVKTNTTNIPVDVINKVTGERVSMQIRLEHEGEFGFTATLTINLEAKNKGLYANLFYYNPKADTGKELEFICADEIDSEGNADLTFTHASDYTIVIDKEPMQVEEPEKPSDPTTPEVTAPKKGTLLTDSKTKMVYKVTKSGTTGGTVQFVKTKNTKAKTVAIPDKVTIDGITYKVTSIAANALKNNKVVTTVTIGKYVTSIGSNAFYGCSRLKKVTIGKSVTTIGSKAFYKCTSLTGITIPSKVTKIGDYVFKGCTKLKTINLSTTLLTTKTVSEKAFSGVSTSAVVKVPKGKLESYKKLFVKKGLSKKVKIKKK